VFSAVNSGPALMAQFGSGNTIALKSENSAVVIVLHSVAFFTTTL
jgi:hypothetical protein